MDDKINIDPSTYGYIKSLENIEAKYHILI